MRSRGAYLTLGTLVLAVATSTGVFLLSSENDTNSSENNLDSNPKPLEGKEVNEVLKGDEKGIVDKEKVNESTKKASTTTTKGSSGSIDPLHGSLPASDAHRTYDSFKTEIWGCTKKLFPEAAYRDIIHDKTEYKSFSYAYWLDWHRRGLKPLLEGGGTGIYRGHDLTSQQKDKTVGCAIAQMKPTAGSRNLGHSTDYYFKSEIVVRNDRIGLILWTDWATNHNHYNSTMTYRMMLMVNKGFQSGTENWSLVGGLWWNDYTASYPTTFSRDHYIKMPGESHPWFKTRDFRSQAHDTKTWSGIWTTDESVGSHIYRDFHVSSKGETQSELLGSSEEPFTKCLARRLCGWNYGGYYYETRDNYAKGWWGFLEFQNIQRELFSWYRPFLGIKGTWKKPSEACVNATSSSNATLKQLCESNQTSTSK